VVDSEEEDSENTSNNKPAAKSPPKAVKRPITPEDTEPEVSTPKAKQTKKVAASAKGKKKDEEEAMDDEPQIAEKDALLMVDNMNKVWIHEELPFVQPNKIQDKNKRKPGDPDYDSRTLFVPQDFLEKQTPGKKEVF
jgi:DNA mismatch repair protein MSH6